MRPVAVKSQGEALGTMAKLLNSLLDISKLESGAVQPDITDVSVQSIFSRLRKEFGVLAKAKGLDLVVEQEEDKVVRSDATLLGQIVQKVVSNAIRYTQQGRVLLRSLALDDVVRIEVVDTEGRNSVGTAAPLTLPNGQPCSRVYARPALFFCPA